MFHDHGELNLLHSNWMIAAAAAAAVISNVSLKEVWMNNEFPFMALVSRIYSVGTSK